MSLHYDESRPSPLQRHYAEQRRAIRARIDAKALQARVARIKEPVVFLPTPSEITASVLVPEALGSRDWLLVFSNPYRKDSLPPGITVKIIAKTAQKFGRLPLDLKSSQRSKYYFIPRHAAMFLCNTLANISHAEIGRKFGGFDHTSSMNAVRKMPARMRADADLCQAVVELEIEIEEYITEWRQQLPPTVGGPIEAAVL